MPRQILSTSQPVDLIAALRRAAKASGKSISQYVGDAIEASLEAKERKRLSVPKRYKKEVTK